VIALAGRDPAWSPAWPRASQSAAAAEKTASCWHARPLSLFRSCRRSPSACPKPGVRVHITSTRE